MSQKIAAVLLRMGSMQGRLMAKDSSIHIFFSPPPATLHSFLATDRSQAPDQRGDTLMSVVGLVGPMTLRVLCSLMERANQDLSNISPSEHGPWGIIARNTRLNMSQQDVVDGYMPAVVTETSG